jgi:hypothetical protein
MGTKIVKAAKKTANVVRKAPKKIGDIGSTLLTGAKTSSEKARTADEEKKAVDEEAKKLAASGAPAKAAATAKTAAAPASPPAAPAPPPAPAPPAPPPAPPAPPVPVPLPFPLPLSRLQFNPITTKVCAATFHLAGHESVLTSKFEFNLPPDGPRYK